MKARILDIHKTEKGSKDLPIQFSEQIRWDLIQRAVISLQNERRQAYGVKHGAGLRQVSEVSRRRRDYKGTYGAGISRVPRKIMSRNGTRMNWVGAIAPGTVGGRQAHPPSAERNWSQKINEKENRKAIRSAISATMIIELTKRRGHLVPKEFPFVLDNKIEAVSKTKEVENILDKLGFTQELERTAKSSIRSGSGKHRGRKYHNKIGPLFVVSQNCPLIKAAANIPGVNVVQVQNLNAEILAPGCHAGRLTLWSEGAIDVLTKQNMYTDDYQGPKQIKEEKIETKKEMKRSKTIANKKENPGKIIVKNNSKIKKSE
ncbi:MAG: 50S ribosomal protein L4 [Nanoarchaeota archaeon]